MEYDPFKYGSFAINAGDQAYRITAEIEKRLGKLAKAESLGEFPRVLAFQSAADATVSASALISRLFVRLPDRGHELVIFDINRVEMIEHLLSTDPAEQLAGLLTDINHSFNLTVVSNATGNGDSPSRDVMIHRRKAGQTDVSTELTEMAWPLEVFSLSHVALPFPKGDPLYGNGNGGEIPTLGNRALRGERGTLLISPGEMLRQKWNPFYSWMEKRSLEFMRLAPIHVSEPIAE